MVHSFFFYAGQEFKISAILFAGEQWTRFEPDTNVKLEIYQVDYKNATFSGTYEIIRNSTISKFPLRGEFDPVGSSIGWVVSYWNEDVNDNTVGVWSGYVVVTPAPNKVRIPILYMKWLITHGDNTTSGSDQFCVT